MNLRTRRMILSVTDQGELLAGNPVLARSIRLRNPYVDPMSLMQVELLRRKRAESRARSWTTRWARRSTVSPPACTIRDRTTISDC